MTKDVLSDSSLLSQSSSCIDLIAMRQKLTLNSRGITECTHNSGGVILRVHFKKLDTLLLTGVQIIHC